MKKLPFLKMLFIFFFKMLLISVQLDSSQISKLIFGLRGNSCFISFRKSSLRERRRRRRRRRRESRRYAELSRRLAAKLCDDSTGLK